MKHPDETKRAVAIGRRVLRSLGYNLSGTDPEFRPLDKDEQAQAKRTIARVLIRVAGEDWRATWDALTQEAKAEVWQ